ncbi:MAG: hypothetical protein JOY98_08405, partial [Candidatus Eremiobacteraeota bacterium]|nr:hypothetical protein [Candidatus Eremiobacteraeota bacterium]
MRRRCWLPSIALVVLAACSSNSSSTVPPTPTPPPPGQIAVAVIGTLQYPGDAVTAIAKQRSYKGPFTYQSSNGAVLCLSLTPPGKNVVCASKVVSKNGIAYVVALGAGSASITIIGGGGAMAHPVSLQNVNIVAAPKIVVTPQQLTFDSIGSRSAMTVDVSQDDYTGKISLKSTCANVATIAEKHNAGGAAAYLVTPVGKGTCAATFFGAYGQSETLPIAVKPSAGVVLSPTRLDLTSASAQTVRVSQSGYRGSFAETDTCAKTATVVASSNGGGKAVYTVTPTANGSCAATFAGGNAAKATLPITVAVPAVSVSPHQVSVTSSGTGGAQATNVTQAGYSGAFEESNNCSHTATVSPTANAGGSATYSVTAIANGSCTATFTGALGLQGQASISVALPGPVVVNPSSLSFTATGAPNAQNVSVTQSGYSGAFTEIDDCAGAATVVKVNTTTYQVTPLADGSCTAVFTGGNAEVSPLAISVQVPGQITATPAPLNFIATGAPNAVTLTVSQPGFVGSFGETDTGAGKATFAVISNAGGTA